MEAGQTMVSQENPQGHKRKLMLALLLLVGLMIAGVSVAAYFGVTSMEVIQLGSQRQKWAARKPDVSRMRTLAEDNNTFAFDLYHQLRKTQHGNVAFSPYSISSSLAMIYGGAEGATKTQIAKVLNFNLEEAEMHSAFADQEYRLEGGINRFVGKAWVANSIWPQIGYTIPKKFERLVKSTYNAEIQPVDFKQPGKAAQLINNWTSVNTNGAIPQVVTPDLFSGTSRMVMVNTMTLLLPWDADHKFANRDTRPSAFYPVPGEECRVGMMNQTTEFQAAVSDNFKVVELPMQQGISILIFLPNERDGLTALEAELSATLLDDVRKSMAISLVDVYLPRFTVDNSLDLKDSFHSLGLTEVFDTSAELGGLLNGNLPLKLNDMLHKVLVEVNEEGAKAVAATTQHVVNFGMVETPTSMEFRVDHPFFFLIQDDESGAVYFMGRVTNPSEIDS